MNKKSINLLSGGLDSATTLYFALQEGYDVQALTVDYGQLHAKEIDCARGLASGLGIPHYVISLSLPWRGSALLDPGIPIPLPQRVPGPGQEIPATYVPARNTIFLSLAASFAEAAGAGVIFIGANVQDYSGYPDCRPEYLKSFADLLALGTKAGVEGKKIKVEAPLLHLSKKEIVELGRRLGVPFEKTWSCYRGLDYPCGSCDACQYRAKGFLEAGWEDPLLHHAESVAKT